MEELAVVASVQRLFDLIVAGTHSVVLLIPMFMIALLVRVTSEGPVIYRSNPIGQGNEFFRMPKFRTMRMDTPSVATHLWGPL